MFVKFPGSRLPVCDTCKRLFKTREICRLRHKHTTDPWTPVYICLTLDRSCTDDGGNIVNKPLVCRPAQPRTYCAPATFYNAQRSQLQPPVCSTCKKANRAKKTCRGRYSHCQLPWSTVYIMLSTADSADPTTFVAPPSQPTEGIPLIYPLSSTAETAVFDGSPSSVKDPRKSMSTNATDDQTNPVESPSRDATAIFSKVSHESPDASDRPDDTVDSHNKTKIDSSSTQNHHSVGDNLYPIPHTRTMLLTISSQSTTITWLEPRSGNTSTRNQALLNVAQNEQFSTIMPAVSITGDHNLPLTSDLYAPVYYPFPIFATNEAASLPFTDFYQMGSQENYSAAPHQPEHSASFQQQQQQAIETYQQDRGLYPAVSTMSKTFHTSAGEAAAAAHQGQTRQDPADDSQDKLPFHEHAHPMPILSQPQNYSAAQFSVFGGPENCFPSFWDFSSQAIQPHVQMHPYAQNSGLLGAGGTFHNSLYVDQLPDQGSVDAGDNSYSCTASMQGKSEILSSPSVPVVNQQYPGITPDTDKDTRKLIRQGELSIEEEGAQKRQRAG